MALIRCSECGNQISDQAKSCPHCGLVLTSSQTQNSKSGINWNVILGIIGIMFFLTWISGGLNVTSSGIEEVKPIVTLAEYNRISTGMTYNQVCVIIGANGTEDVSSRIDGVPGVMDAIVTVGYSWVNRDGANMNAMFQNGKLVQKAQFGLK